MSSRVSARTAKSSSWRDCRAFYLAHLSVGRSLWRVFYFRPYCAILWLTLSPLVFPPAAHWAPSLLFGLGSKSLSGEYRLFPSPHSSELCSRYFLFSSLPERAGRFRHSR